jgi:hypothetical protein
MTRQKIAVVAAAVLALAVAPGCAKHDRPEAAPRADGQADSAKRADSGKQPGPEAQNEQNARKLLEEAEQAERQGQYSLAMNLYERLRSFPEASRPQDLDQRMSAVRQKMAAEGGGTRGPTTMPAEPR